MASLFSDANPTYPPLDTLKPVTEGVWIIDSGPLRILGMPVPVRMTVVRLAEGGLWLHSPTRFVPALRHELERLGPVRHLVAPNVAHWSFLPDWQRAFPRALAWGPSELQRGAQLRKKNVRFDRTLENEAPPDWAGEIEQIGVAGGAGFKEIDFFHKPSRTLILTDLVLNIESEKMPPAVRPGLRLVGVAAPDGRAPVYLRATIKMKREAARKAAERMIAMGPERVIFSHGRWFETNGAAALRRSLRWLVGEHEGENAKARSFPHPVLTGTAIVGAGLALGAYLYRRAEKPARIEASPARRLLPYSDDVETIEPDEEATIDGIIAAMAGGERITRERYGRAARSSHAKAHGLLKGELRVLDDLPTELRQGLFAAPDTYPVVVRLAQVPAEFFDDRKVSTPRGMAIKVLDVNGEMLPVHRGERTQDFVLDTGKTFIAPGARTFLAQITATQAAAALPASMKGAVSTAARVTNEALNAVGLNSANLDFYGHPYRHPLGETYYSQCPFRYGDYVAKLRVAPASPGLRALVERTIRAENENGVRAAVVNFFATQGAEFEVGI